MAKREAVRQSVSTFNSEHFSWNQTLFDFQSWDLKNWTAPREESNWAQKIQMFCWNISKFCHTVFGYVQGCTNQYIPPLSNVSSHHFQGRNDFNTRILRNCSSLDVQISYFFGICISLYRVFFFTGPPPKKLKYGKPRLGEVKCI